MSLDTEPRIYRYILTTDDGTAPNPFDGYYTLAICKPDIRRTARKGDWVLGFRSRAHDRLIYAMEVSETPAFEEYWRDKRFRRRRPGDATVPADNIYKPMATIGPDGVPQFKQVRNPSHGEDQQERDLRGKRILVATRFWYFGGAAPVLPPSLAALQIHHRGHVVHRGRRPGDLKELLRWLGRYPAKMIGAPTHESPTSARDCSTCSTTSARPREHRGRRRC